MKSIWMLSPTAMDSSGNLYPTCNAYSSSWTRFPVMTTGRELVYCGCTEAQIEAAQSDPDIVVISSYRDALPAAVTQAYAAQGAKDGITLAALLVLLGNIEPNFLLYDPNIATLIALGLV